MAAVSVAILVAWRAERLAELKAVQRESSTALTMAQLRAAETGSLTAAK